MRDPNKAVQALSDRTEVRDPRTGQVRRKPAAPPMRQVIKGGWVYKELPPTQEPQGQEENDAA
jgi:hypothetical protein